MESCTKKNRRCKRDDCIGAKILPELLKTSTECAEKLIELLQSKGTSFARSHVNIEPTPKITIRESISTQKRRIWCGVGCFSAARYGVFYTNSVSIGRLMMPIPVLYKHKINVMTGNDSIIDHWNTWGSGSVLKKRMKWYNFTVMQQSFYCLEV